MDFVLIFILTIDYGFWSNFHANTIDYGFRPNFSLANAIGYRFWSDFHPNTIDYRIWSNFHTNTIVGSRVGAVSERSPPTNVARVRFPDSASNVG